MRLRATLLALLLTLAVPLSALAQDVRLSPEALGKLDGEFQLLLQNESALGGKSAGGAVMTPVLEKAASVDAFGTTRYSVILHTDDAEALRAAGLPVNATLGPVSTAQLTADQIRTAAGLDAVRFVEAPTELQSHNDEAAREVGARVLNGGAVNNTTYSGQGVLTCVVDSGIDVNHGDFKDASGNTRILYLWDQVNDTAGQAPSDRDASFSGLNYGTEYSAADIDGGSVSQEDTDGHGTHVAGTVASSGNALVLSGSQTTPEHRGMAPEADIIVVKAGNGSFSNTNIINAMDYCGTVADNQGKPLVINMSLGGNSGPHDGTSALDLAVDAFTDATPSNGTLDPGTAPNKIVVVSAGNNGGSPQHVSGSIASGASDTTPWTVSSYSSESGVVNDFFATQTWFDTADDVTVTVTSPDGNDTATLAASGTSSQTNVVETPSGTIYLESGVSSDNGDRYFDVQVYDWEDDSVSPAQEIIPATGTWQIEIQNNGSAATMYHGWTWTQTFPGQYDNGDDQYTVGSPGTADGAITVASHTHRWYWGNSSGAYAYNASFSNRDGISAFSSPGPRRDGAVKPDISAPGEGMISAYSQDMSTVSSSRVFDEDGVHRMTQGTSMSSPVVAGSVALLLQAANGQGQALTANDVKQLLIDYAVVDNAVTNEGAVPNVRFGHGKLDILRPVLDVLGGSGDREILAYHDNAGFSQTDTLTIGGSYSEKVAVRFTPSTDGVVTGSVVMMDANFRSEGGAPVNTTGGLVAEIWSDNGSGQPDAKLGTTVIVPGEQLNQLTPNAIDLEPAGVSVLGGVDYHLVFSMENQNATETIAMFSENSSPNGRTQVLNGGTWAATKDLNARVEISVSDNVSGAIPVELAGFTGVASDGAVLLQWSTLSETNNAGFYIDHKAPGDESFVNVNFVKGMGTTDQEQRYGLRIADLAPGRHTFQLRQKDVDGSVLPVAETTVDIGMTEAFRLSKVAPNPVSAQGRITLQVRDDQPVRAELYNLLGQRIQVLHDATLRAGESKDLMVNGSRLASGVYFLRVEGEAFSAVRKITVVR